MIRYILDILLAYDQLINAIFGGYPDETISYRASIASAEGKLWGCWFCRLIEKLLPNHCDLHRLSKSQRLSRGATWEPPL